MNTKEEAEKEYKVLQGIHKEISRLGDSLTSLVAQLNENEMVKKELDFLEPDAVVYKQVGPVLVKQELEEANVNVSKRIEYLTAEMKRIEDTLTDLNKKKEVKTKKIMEMQQAMQAAAQAAAKK
eukprot:c8075_g1_i3.p1 GENE.c8075_g1_i3~~c8075_g1_i3.p1  ORF type:complete len:124 (-),score=38.35 c8075_g1_i3:230-601(-)